MFCENCGKQLQDGEVCTCTQQVSPMNEQPVYQPAEIPVSQPAPEAPQTEAAPAPAYQPQPAYQQPAYQQPAPQPAPQPAYQPAYQQPVQPAYQQPAPQPAYQQPVQPYAYTPVSKPVAEKPSGYGKPRYNLMAQFLSSPIILVFGIMYAVTLLFSLINIVSTFNFASVFSLIGVLVESLIPVAALITWVSAKNYTTKGTPISPSGLTIASGLFKAYGIVWIVITSIFTLFILIICGISKSGYPLIMLIVPVILVFFQIVFYFSLSNAFKSVRHEITDRYFGSGISLYPVVIKCIGMVGQVLSLIFTIMLVASTSKIYSMLNNTDALRDIRRSLGKDAYNTIMSFFMPSTGAIAISIITSLIALAVSVIAVIILVKARQVKGQAYTIKQ